MTYFRNILRLIPVTKYNLFKIKPLKYYKISSINIDSGDQKGEIPSEMSKYRQNLQFWFADKIKLISDFDFEQFFLNLISF